MATKRMFSNDIVESDAFLEMPATSQNLYFHLGMRCDDDGFVNPTTTMRMIGANKNDLDVLVSKRFLLIFKNGVVVLKHHRINNNWDSRDSRRTLYTEELRQLFIKENKAYTLDEEQGVEVEKIYSKNNTPALPDGNPTGNRRQKRIEENRIEENRREEVEPKKSKTIIELPEWIDKDSWSDWLTHRKERKLADYKEMGIKKLFTQLENEYSKDTERLKKAIDYSIAKNYQGIYEKKDYRNNQKPVNNVINSNTNKIIQAMNNKNK